MPVAVAGAVELAYETHGDPGDPPLLLIAGLGQQLTMWPMPFVHTLAVAGYRVIRFDNRDVGLSTHLGGKLNLSEIAAAMRGGQTPEAPYTLGDMAADAAGLLDHLGIERTHVVGISMGGAIAQELAIHHGLRVRSMACVMATTGAADVGQPNATGNRALFRAPPHERAGAIASMIESAALLASPGHFDERSARHHASMAYDRAFDPEGVGRQLGAIWVSGDRTVRLKEVVAPALVIHGDADPLIDVSGGRAIAVALPAANYVEIHGMAHDLPTAFWPEILGPLLQHLAAA